MSRRRSLVVLALAAACGSGDASSGGTADAGDRCDRSGFATSRQLAERDDELGVLFYTAFAGDGDPFDRLTVDFYFPIGATDGPQTVELLGEDLADCHTCLLLFRGCAGSLCTAATTYLARRGTLTVTAMGAAGTPFAATLREASFAEVEIDFATQQATPVPGGETWCLADQAMGATIEAP
jgi:hypothetical protein